MWMMISKESKRVSDVLTSDLGKNQENALTTFIDSMCVFAYLFFFHDSYLKWH